MSPKSFEGKSTVTTVESGSEKKSPVSKFVAAGAAAALALGLAGCGSSAEKDRVEDNSLFETSEVSESLEETLSPAEYNAKVLEEFYIGDNIDLSKVEEVTRNIMIDQGSTPQVIYDRQAYLDRSFDAEGVMELDVSRYGQLSYNLALYANLLQANSDLPLFNMVQQAGAQDIIMNIPMIYNDFETEAVDIQENAVVRSLTEFVEYLPEDAIILDAEILSSRMVMGNEMSTGTWSWFTVQYSDGSTKRWSVQVSNRPVEGAERLNPYVSFDSIIYDDTPMQVGFLHDPNGVTYNDFENQFPDNSR